MTALCDFATGPAKIILVHLCLSLADLALQLPEWPSVVADMTEKFGKTPETVPILLEFLTVLPQEILGNHQIKITVCLLLDELFLTEHLTHSFLFITE